MCKIGWQKDTHERAATQARSNPEDGMLRIALMALGVAR
jgi:hypothetical protein